MLWSRFICFTLLCVMCGEAASIKVFIIIIFNWHYTKNHFEIKLNDCLEWELLSLCCGVWPLIVIYRDGKRNSGRAGWGTGDVLIIFHCDGDVKVLQDLYWRRENCRPLDPARWVSFLCGSLDNYKSSNLRYCVWWNNCTWLWMSYFTS